MKFLSNMKLKKEKKKVRKEIYKDMSMHLLKLEMLERSKKKFLKILRDCTDDKFAIKKLECLEEEIKIAKMKIAERNKQYKSYK